MSGLIEDSFRILKAVFILLLIMLVFSVVILFYDIGGIRGIGGRETTSIEGDFTITEKSEVVHDRYSDYQYLTLEDEYGKKYVVKTNIYESNQYAEGDVVNACFKAITFKDRVECRDVIIEPKETEKTEKE